MRYKLKLKHNYTGYLKMLALIVVGSGLLLALFWTVWGYHFREWDGQTRFTRIYLMPHLVIESFDPASRQGVRLTFPDDLVIESISGRGSWKAGVIAKAGSQTWAADSVANYLGIAYTAVGNSLDWWDQLQWRLWSGKIAWSQVDVRQTSALEQFTTPDGMTAYQLSRAWDTKAEAWFFDQTIESQLLGVIIVNTTTTEGLGASASRVVESMGFKVRSLSNADQEVKKCLLKTLPQLKSSLAVRKLQKSFACDWQASDIQDLTLVLGDQYRSWKTGD